MTTTACDDQFVPEPVEPVRQPYDTAAILRRNVADAEKEMQRQAERAESYAEAMRSLASYVGAGGYNADAVDAGVFEDKIRWGIGEIQDRLAGAIERELVARTSLIEARNDIQTWIDSRNEWMKRAEAAEAELLAIREDNHSMMLEIHNLRIERDALAATAPGVAIDAEAFEIHRMNRLIAADPKMNAPSSPTDEQIHAAYRNALGQSIRERDMPEIRKFAIALLQSAPQAPAAPAPSVPVGDDFNGTTPHMIQCIEALVSMNDSGVLAPHGIGSHARTLLIASANRLRQQAAPSVPEEWREVMTELADDLAIEIDQSYPPERRAYPSEQRRYEMEMAIVNRARALLQSAEGCCSQARNTQTQNEVMNND